MDVRGVTIPDREEDFAADPSELFFDLVFVFAFSRLVDHLVHHPTWSGIGGFALLFTMIWMPWTQFTWSANAVAGNSRPVRFLFLVASVASVPMAGSVSAALDDGAPVFAISLSVILSIGVFTMVVGLGPDEPVVLRSILKYSVLNWIAVALMVAGGFVGHDARIALWVAAMGAVILGTIRAGRYEWLVRPGHFSERHSLILIVALGEVIVALGVPVVEQLDEGAGLPGRTVVALVAAGIFAGELWWGYFDRPSPALEHRHETIEDPVERGRYARDIYTYAHFPLIAGVVLASAALEEITVHPDQALGVPFRWMFFAGIVSYLGAVVIAVARAFKVLAVERLVAIAVMLGVVVVLGRADGVIVLAATDVVLLATLVAEHYRVEIAPRQVVLT